MTVFLACTLTVVVLTWALRERLAARRDGDHRDRQRSDGERAAELRRRLRAAERRGSELEAAIASMVEGVVVLDSDERLVSLNRAAARLLALDPDAAVGRPLHEVARHAPLQGLVDQAMESRTPAEREMTLRPGPATSTDDRAVHAHVSLIDGHNGNDVQAAAPKDGLRGGAVIVLHDLTQLRRLESVRRDFVANVSHEIKTPISAIKAAVETLADSPDATPQDRARFIGMIARQSDRLDAIVEDLLSLARIEQDEDRIATEMSPVPVASVLHAAVETCGAKAAEKSIRLELDAPPLVAPMVPSLIEQAVINLIDNAVKYSPPDTVVRVTARGQGDELILAVADQGRGIEADHLPRVFERFYRTDRARSRALGGTGLGLSIVRHIAQAHSGRATAESHFGQGSTFRLHLPRGAVDATPPRQPA